MARADGSIAGIRQGIRKTSLLNMTSDISLLKKQLRQQLRARLESISPADRKKASLKACALLRQQTIWQNAKNILFYAPIQDEIDLLMLLEEALEAGKNVALPGFNLETGTYEAFLVRGGLTDCVQGKFGILEPNKTCLKFGLNRLDLVLVPGVGFGPDGHRLGRGRGFYDRLLAQISGAKCGIAFDEQITTRIPAEMHDVKLNFILTPTRWLAVAHQSPQSLPNESTF